MCESNSRYSKIYNLFDPFFHGKLVFLIYHMELIILIIIIYLMQFKDSSVVKLNYYHVTLTCSDRDVIIDYHMISHDILYINLYPDTSISVNSCMP